jgi:hypothetical protein
LSSITAEAAQSSHKSTNDGTRRHFASGCNNTADRGHTAIQNQLNNQLGCGREE